MLKVIDGFVEFARVEVHNRPVQIVILFVEYVLLVVVCAILVFLLGSSSGTLPLGVFALALFNHDVVRCLCELLIKLLELLFVHQITDLFIVVCLLFLLSIWVVLVLHAESQVVLARLVSPTVALLHLSVLLSAAPDRFDLVGLCALRTGDDLGVLIED